jgi:hypothetical protein
MVLPVWAHARGKTYDTLIIQDDNGTGVAGELALASTSRSRRPTPTTA